MSARTLKESFLKLCEEKKYEKNVNQLKIIDSLINFIKNERKFIYFILNTKKKLCFYLYGGVGVGKTMILNHFYESLNIPKQRKHFNEFMINFHDYRHKNKDKENSINSFVKELKEKYKLIYLDEFQVTNIVDAMILGKLFETIFKENIKIIITSNIKIDDLYQDGLQREKFLPFISIIKKNSIQKKLIIDEDYRMLLPNKLQRVFYPINEKTTFKINQLFRELTKNKKLKELILTIKGRKFKISDFYEGIAKVDFKNLCDTNLGAEDYIQIANSCRYIVIQNIPNFNNENVNQQQRFITLIDILYEKKVSLMISIESKLDFLTSSENLSKTFKRTTSRLFELTSPQNNFF